MISVWGVLTAAILPVFHTWSWPCVSLRHVLKQQNHQLRFTRPLIAPVSLARLRALCELVCPTSEPSSQHACGVHWASSSVEKLYDRMRMYARQNHAWRALSHTTAERGSREQVVLRWADSIEGRTASPLSAVLLHPSTGVEQGCGRLTSWTTRHFPSVRPPSP
jgi:hypothetical protein